MTMQMIFVANANVVLGLDVWTPISRMPTLLLSIDAYKCSSERQDTCNRACL